MLATVPKITLTQDSDPDVSTDQAIGIAQDLTAKEIVEFAAKHSLWHIVHSSTPHFEQEIKVAELMISELNKFLSYPISSILKPESAGAKAESEFTLYSRRFSRAAEKREVLGELAEKLLSQKNPGSFVQEVVLVADEMFTNAIYNAPYVTFAKNGPGAERTPSNGNADLKQGRLFLGATDDRIVLGCEDNYGTLNPSHMLSRLQACLTNGTEESINWSSGGAGLGTYMMFRSSLSFFTGVEKERKTVIACTFRRRRRKSSDAQSIHLSSNIKTNLGDSK